MESIAGANVHVQGNKDGKAGRSKGGADQVGRGQLQKEGVWPV